MRTKLLTFWLMVIFLIGCSKTDEEGTKQPTKELGQSMYRTGNPRPIDAILEDGRREEVFKLTVESVSTEPKEEEIWLAVNVHIENTSTRPWSLHYSETALVDSKERMYVGEVWPLNFRIPRFRIPRMGGLIENLQPGLSERNFVFFRLPKSSFSSDVYFGMVTQDSKVGQRILIYEQDKSKHTFDESKKFDTSAWN